MTNLKVLTVFGTRPDAVKMAPLVKELESHPEFTSLVCVTAQHRQMLDQVLDIFSITPDYDLNIMQDRQSLEQITVKALSGLSKVFEKEQPNIVLVHGDTTTCFTAALAAFYNKIPIGHVEAGLRTFDDYSPYPEEMNRKLTGALANLHFAPTASNFQNLINENIQPQKIYVTGNTVIDALKTTVNNKYVFQDKTLKRIDFTNKRIIAVTAHRRENLGEPLKEICLALKKIAENYSDVEIVYAVHLNPAVSETAHSVLDNIKNVHLINPLDVQDMHNLIARSCFIMTDSGGLQEEAPALAKPVLVLRKETERPEAVEAGTVKLAGTSFKQVYQLASKLLDDTSEYAAMAKAVNPYGDGCASSRIASALLHEFGFCKVRPPDFASLYTKS